MAKKDSFVKGLFYDFLAKGIIRFCIFVITGIGLMFAFIWGIIKLGEIVGSIFIG